MSSAAAVWLETKPRGASGALGGPQWLSEALPMSQNFPNPKQISIREHWAPSRKARPRKFKRTLPCGKLWRVPDAALTLCEMLCSVTPASKLACALFVRFGWALQEGGPQSRLLTLFRAASWQFRIFVHLAVKPPVGLQSPPNRPNCVNPPMLACLNASWASPVRFHSPPSFHVASLG